MSGPAAGAGAEQDLRRVHRSGPGHLRRRARRGRGPARGQRRGKTTTIRMLLGLLRPTAGHALLNGNP